MSCLSFEMTAGGLNPWSFQSMVQHSIVTEWGRTVNKVQWVLHITAFDDVTWYIWIRIRQSSARILRRDDPVTGHVLCSVYMCSMCFLIFFLLSILSCSVVITALSARVGGGTPPLTQ